LDNFFYKGQVWCNSLSYFLSCEDKTRRDKFEGINFFKPADGLVLTNVRTQEIQIIPAGLLSTINPSQVFVFCASTEFNDYLYNKFHAKGCVEICDLEAFTRRIRSQIMHQMPSIKNKTLLADTVVYYDHSAPPENRYAFPELIVMSKTKYFEDEKEYRFAFSRDKNAFEQNKIRYSITKNILQSDNQIHFKEIKLGDLSDICKIIR